MLPHLDHRYSDGGEGRSDIGGDGDVVEPDDRNLLWHAGSVVAKLAEDADGHRVVEADNGRHALLKKFFGSGNTALTGEWFRHNGEVDPWGLRSFPQSVDAVGNRVQSKRACHNTDSTMPQFREVASDGYACAVVVGEHGIDVQMVSPDYGDSAAGEGEALEGF